MQEEIKKEEVVVEVTNINKEIEFDDFMKVEMKVGKILEVSEVEGSDKLYKLKVSFGEVAPRTVFSGVKKFFAIEDLLNKKFVFVTNLKKRKIMGEFSEAMILAAEDNGVLAAFSPNKDVVEGSSLR